jgi:hypothetical protein
MHSHEVDVHEERLAVLRVLLDVGDRRLGLPHVEFREGLVVDPLNLLRRLAGHAFPFVQVRDLLVLLIEFRVVRREPGMRQGPRVVIEIDARVVGAEVLHLVEAVRDRVKLGLVAEMPLP